MKGFCDVIKTVYKHSLTTRVHRRRGVLLKDKIVILGRWAEYFKDLLNTDNLTDPSEVSKLPQYPTVLQMDNPFTEAQVAKAINSLKVCKAAGP